MASTSVIPVRQAEQAGDTLWSFNNVGTYPGPKGLTVLHNSATDRRLLVQRQVAEALHRCSNFRTLEAHKQAIIQGLPHLKGQDDSVLSALGDVANAGLLESATQCWTRLVDLQQSRELKSAGRAFIITCDRPVALERILTSLTVQGLPTDLEGIWVVDDSRMEANALRNSQIIESVQKVAPFKVRHVDDAARSHLIGKIKTSLPGHGHVIDWLLTREVWGDTATYGVARNITLLLSVGKKAFVLDDDILPEAVAPPLASSGLRFSDANEREAIFYNTNEDLLQHTLTIAQSPLALMQQSLGQKLSSLLPRHLKNPSDLAGLDGNRTARLTGSSPVLMTQCGSWGDPGTSDSKWIFHLPNSSIEKLLSKTADIDALVGARNCWHGYKAPAISGFGTLSQLTGLDHNYLMPPYLPAGRGEDIVFGVSLNLLHPQSVVFNEAWAIHHAPIEGRDSRASLEPISCPLSHALLVDWLSTDPTASWGLPAEAKLSALADRLEIFSQLEPDIISSLLIEGLVSRRSQLLHQCVKRIEELDNLQHLPGHAQWKRFLEGSRDRLAYEIQTPEGAITGPGGKPAQEALTSLKDHGSLLSQALKIWPEICDLARNLES